MVNQMNKGRKRKNNYEVRDLVRISVPKIDYFGKIDSLGVNQFPELKTILTNLITVREAAQL
ncbi:hypothetical protein RhiirA4_465372 [Rhizophagus irregularis]|uniref:Uncharacterized protein n=1 Tax=Rhizophagus irregularis TaxID=588596 RepID=A0A2I1GRY8_9GLOM|nr:hypothetical protein RhiirA4_465372 [Rhizophagus irregularis]